MGSTRLLLLRFGALGDLLLATPALAALRARIPGVHLTLVGHGEAVSLLRESGLADVAMSQDDPCLLDIFTDRQSSSHRNLLGEFDAAVAWLKDTEGTVAGNLARLAIGRVVIAPSVPPADAEMHVADHLLATLGSLGIESLKTGCLPTGTEGHGSGTATGERPEPFRLRIPLEAELWAKAHQVAHYPEGAPVVAIHPGSGSPRKNWEPHKFSAVADNLATKGIQVILIGGQADRSAIAGVLAAAKCPLPVLRDPTLPHLAALLARCTAYLGNDSGVTHLAALVGVPVVALFGPTDPEVWGPRGSHVIVLRWDAGQELPVETVAEVVSKSIHNGQA